MNKKVIIIGAGPAGLTAAYKLLKENKNINVTVLEESSDIGGISKTVTYKNNRMDIGGHRFFTKVDEVKDLWNEIMPLQGSPSKDDIFLNRNVKLTAYGPDPEKEDKVMLYRQRISRILYLRKFFDYPISMKPQTFINMGLTRTLKAGFGYLNSAFIKKEETNLENFYINRFGKSLYKMFFEKYTEKVWGRHPREIDASWGAQRVKGLNLLKTFANAISKPFRKNNKNVETSLIESFMYPKKGPGQLYEEMANKIKEMGGEILFNHEVNNIVLTNSEIDYISCSNGKSFKGDYYISSMPLKDLINSINKDKLNEDIIRIANGLIYRDFMTVGLLLNKLNLKNTTKIKTINNIIPDTWIYVQEDDVKLGRIQIFNNWSPYMVDDINKHIWIGLEYFVNEGDSFWKMDDAKFINFAIDELIKIHVLASKEDVVDSTLVKVKKAYPGYFDTYKEIATLKDYLLSISNLYCVGRNGQHRYNNMDHSMLTAINSAKHILGDTSISKESVWEVNVEKEYHEEKNK
jgi:protoporphyrinogen oxidase